MRRRSRANHAGTGALAPFWRTKNLDELTPKEWESLCDGCGLCCQIRVEDEDTGELALSDVACRLLDLCTNRCSDYGNRHQRVPDCVAITPENVYELTWLPHSCAYRLVAHGYDLPDWHHLVCGDRQRVHEEGPSMLGMLVSEDEVDWSAQGEAED
ncbi:YcgN family cysteine cluster protein [Geminicoccus harenae]|uniref:YcgN family cysteine cluster protein n=1 Tax=Geminicoccus harenae TaxID=2498453 RepID=UPI00168ABAE7|nr:YcgN family cysteine cluster protein [Geminicoccus harenae]